MIAASGVLLSHAYPITQGIDVLEPFQAETGQTLGEICVAIFFGISGFLITRSMDRRPDAAYFVSARVLRLFPALIVVTILTVLCLGPAFTTLPLTEYFGSRETWSYVPRNVGLYNLQWGLPGVFGDNPRGSGINGSLWTLFYEVTCYLGVFALGLTGVLASRVLRAGAVIAYFALYVLTGLPFVAEELPEKVGYLRMLSLPFAIGMAMYIYRDRCPLSFLGAIALAAFAWALINTPAFEIAFSAALIYATFVLGYKVGGPLKAYNDLGDYSYGMYVYAFPVQQSLVALFGAMTPLANAAIAFPITLFFAIASWYLIEKPANDQKRIVAQAMGRVRIPRMRPAGP